MNGFHPDWSDDGTKFVYADWLPNPADIVISSADGTEISRVSPILGIIVPYLPCHPTEPRLLSRLMITDEFCDEFDIAISEHLRYLHRKRRRLQPDPT